MLNLKAKHFQAYLEQEEKNYQLIQSIIEGPEARVSGKSLKTSPTINVLATIKDEESITKYLTEGVGVTKKGDVISRPADYLLGLSDVETKIIYGIVDSHLGVSIRTKDPTVDAAELAKALLGNKAIGDSINGTGIYMACAPLSSFNLPESDEQNFSTLVTKIILKNFYEAIKTNKEKEKS